MALVWLHFAILIVLVVTAGVASHRMQWSAELSEPTSGLSVTALMVIKAFTVAVTVGVAMSEVDFQGCCQPFGCLRACPSWAAQRERDRRAKRGGIPTPVLVLEPHWVKGVSRAKFLDAIVGLWLLIAVLSSQHQRGISSGARGGAAPGAGAVSAVLAVAVAAVVAVDLWGLLLMCRAKHCFKAWLHERLASSGGYDDHDEEVVPVGGGFDCETDGTQHLEQTQSPLWSTSSSSSSASPAWSPTDAIAQPSFDSPAVVRDDEPQSYHYLRYWDSGYESYYCVHSLTGEVAWQCDLPLSEHGRVRDEQPQQPVYQQPLQQSTLRHHFEQQQQQQPAMAMWPPPPQTPRADLHPAAACQHHFGDHFRSALPPPPPPPQQQQRPYHSHVQRPPPPLTPRSDLHPAVLQPQGYY